MSTLSDLIWAHLPPKRKQTPSGWWAVMAVCCQHRGHVQDRRGRGGYIVERDVVSYSCFNCGFKASWQPGRNMTYKMRQLLGWLGVSDDTITKVAIDILRSNANVTGNSYSIQFPTFNEIELPPKSVPLTKTNDEKSIPLLEYILDRQLDINDTTFYFSSDLKWRTRLIIPFYYQRQLVGYTGRTVRPDGKPKYLTSSQPGYVYNLDNQHFGREFGIVCEGPIDALYVDGISVLGADISEGQLMLLNSLQRELVIVPDRDKAGLTLVEHALENNWSVSMPPWDSDVNDIGDAVNKYGRALTLYSIVKYKESNQLKIKLGMKKWIK